MAAPDLPLPERTLGRVLAAAVRRAPDKLFLAHREQRLTYRAFDLLTNRVANALAGLGLAKGGKMGLMVPNSLEFLGALFAAGKLGAVYVPINLDYKGDILGYQLAKADVTHMVIDARYLDRLAAVQGALPKLSHVIVRREAGVEAPAAAFDPRIAVVEYADLEQGAPTPIEVEVSFQDPLAISFTSGTTGPSKGVLASHCHILTFSLDWVEANGFGADDVLYTPLPLFHAIASWLGIFPTAICGATAHIADRFSASRFWDEARACDATVVHGIFAIVPMLLKQPASPLDRQHRVRLFYIGQQNEEFEARFGVRVVEVYGATETGIVTYTPLAETRRKGSCGKANGRSYEVKILDEDDNECPPGSIGEICVRPRQPFSMMREYYNMPAETVAAFRNLWFHTGDSGRMDADGYFYFVDRKKDAMRRRGENISSFELESVFYKHPKVMECAAVAVPSALGEDEVKVVVVPREGEAVTAAELWDFAREHMPLFWVPRYIEFRASLPKTPNQKVQKYLLRQGVEQGEVFEDPQAGQLTGARRRA